MKHIVGISLGSSSRDHEVKVEVLDQVFKIERRGTDGSIEKAIKLIEDLDGKADAFGLGGIDLYIYAGDKRYTLRDAKRIADKAKKTPIVDGSGLKNTLERRVIAQLIKQGYQFNATNVLMVCGADRFGMAQSLYNAGANITFGDLIFALGIPIPIKSLANLERAIAVLAPVVCNLPFKMLYPTGEKQVQINSKYGRFFSHAEIIAGDFHYIRRYMPESLKDKTIITNTITKNDLQLLKERDLKRLITTTPELEGRSFGTNVMEAMLVSILGEVQEEERAKRYYQVLEQLMFEPRIVDLYKEKDIV